MASHSQKMNQAFVARLNEGFQKRPAAFLRIS
jgi:hypothetical protein